MADVGQRQLPQRRRNEFAVLLFRVGHEQRHTAPESLRRVSYRHRACGGVAGLLLGLLLS
jgi:hypothetical protein